MAQHFGSGITQTFIHKETFFFIKQENDHAHDDPSDFEQSLYEKIADLITKEARHFHLTGKISSRVLTVAGSTIQSGISGFINKDIVEQDIDFIKPNELYYIDPKHQDFTFENKFI